MKNIIILLLLLTSRSFVKAQSSIGFHFGVGGYYTLEKGEGLQPEKNLSSAIGLDLQVKLKKGFYFYTSMGVLKISDESIANGSFSGGTGGPVLVEFKRHRFVMFLPTQVGMKYARSYDKFRFFIQPYIETDILLFSESKIRIYPDDARIEYGATTSSILEATSIFYTIGFGFGLGIEKDLGEKISMYLMPDIKLLFTDITISTERKSIVSAVKLGLLYKL